MSAKQSAGGLATDTITVFVEVRLNGQGEESRQHFEKAIAAHPEVLECFAMTGDADYLLRVTATDVRSYHSIAPELETTVMIATSSRSLSASIPRVSQLGAADRACPAARRSRTPANR